MHQYPNQRETQSKQQHPIHPLHPDNESITKCKPNLPKQKSDYSDLNRLNLVSQKSRIHPTHSLFLGLGDPLESPLRRMRLLSGPAFNAEDDHLIDDTQPFERMTQLAGGLGGRAAALSDVEDVFSLDFQNAREKNNEQN